MSRTRIVQGKITKITGKDHFIYSKGSITNNAATKVIQKGEQSGVFYGKPNFPDLKYESTEYKLKSPFAHEQLLKIAKELSEMTFVLIMLQIFGDDIEIEALGKLYKDLCDKKLQPPEIIVTKDPIKNYKANYSNKRKVILVSSGFLEEATKNNEIKAQLLASLVEEYGHHIDNLLRTEYATHGKEDKDRIDEGAKFAYFLLTVDFANTPQLDFAETETPEYTGKLILDLSTQSQDLSKFVDQQQWYDDDPTDDDIENFGFGFGKGAHGGIEMNALFKKNIFLQEEVLQIYYGNWLRDVSQVLVPMTIRFTKEVRSKIEQNNKNDKNKINHLLAGNTAKFSHDGWVELIELFAAKEFVYTMGGEDMKTQNYVKHLDIFRKKYGEMTKDILGIYRPEEHIDNPKDLTDDRIGEIMFKRETINGFEEWDFYAGQTPDCFQTNSFGQKYYIYRDSEDGQKKAGREKDFIKADALRPSADTYMINELKLAVKYGKTRDGFRHLGGAFHVLEDYFSHTNFVELSLCKLGYTNPQFVHLKKVYPWVEGKQGTDYKKIPIVTGKFLLDDTAASIIPKMADMLLPIGFTEYKLAKPGERTFGQQTIYTVLKDLAEGQKEDPTKNNETYLGMDSVELFEYYNKLLELSDYILEMKSGENPLGYILRFFDKISHFLGKVMTNFTNVIFNILIESTDDDIKETQTEVTNKNYGENPTHTQIAKDTIDHPLNGLASELAEMAVADIGQRIKNIWEGKTIDPNGDLLANYILNTYSRHPRSVTWMDAHILNWSKNVNKKVLESLYFPTPLAHAHDSAKRQVFIGKEKLDELLKYFK